MKAYTPKKKSIKEEIDIDKSIDDLVREGKCYWKDGQLYQNPNYKETFTYKPTKRNGRN